ncbi:MAG: hypothetical protein MUC28_00880 [Planctomycetes bacterium]|jgi:hypothetical protein|nr:hypothetical protein [Planctomycetota bacterium]
MKKVFGIFEEDLIELPRVNEEMQEGAKIVAIVFVPDVNEPLFIMAKSEEE